MEEVPPSTESTADLPRSQDGDMPFTSGEREGSFVGDGAIPPEYGPTPSVSSIPPSITPSASSDVHPFKLERYVDNKGNTRTRIYLGRLRYLINNFDVLIQSDTRSTATYGSQGSGSSEVTGLESAHTHSINGYDDSGDGISLTTGGVNSSSGGSGTPNGHVHTIPALVNSTVTVDRFICVKNQSQGAGFINEIEPDGFTAIKDSNDKDTVLKAKDMPINQTYGSFFLKWSITLPTGSASGATIAADSITIHRDSDPTKTAEQLQNDFGAMSALTANSETAAMGSFKRGSHSEADRTATYYVKLGVSYDPNAAGTNSKSIEQITYENVYWCPLFISSIPS